MAMPGFFIDTPAIEAYDHGLVDSATRKTIDDPDNPDRWVSGGTFNTHTHIVIHGTCAMCDAPVLKSAEQTCTNPVAFYPYLLEFGVYEKTGSRTPDRLFEEMSTMMRVGTSARLEDLQVVGCTGTDNPVLADGASLTGGTAALIIGRMAEYFYDADQHIGAQGTIYMSPVDFVKLGFDLVTEVDGILRTKFGGHKVIVGNYPSGTIYGHLGDVDLYLTDVFIPEAPDSIKTSNVIRGRVERYGMAVWDSTHTVKATVS